MPRLSRGPAQTEYQVREHLSNLSWHRKKLDNVKSTIPPARDDTQAVFRKRLRRNRRAGKRAVEKEQRKEIRHSNSILVKKLLDISQRKSEYSSEDGTPHIADAQLLAHHITRERLRLQQQQKIAKENIDLAVRIMARPPEYSRSQWEEHERRHTYLSARISRANMHSVMPADEATMDMMAASLGLPDFQRTRSYTQPSHSMTARVHSPAHRRARGRSTATVHGSRTARTHSRRLHKHHQQPPHSARSRDDSIVLPPIHHGEDGRFRGSSTCRGGSGSGRGNAVRQRAHTHAGLSGYHSTHMSPTPPRKSRTHVQVATAETREHASAAADAAGGSNNTNDDGNEGIKFAESELVAAAAEKKSQEVEVKTADNVGEDEVQDSVDQGSGDGDGSDGDGVVGFDGVDTASSHAEEVAEELQNGEEHKHDEL